MTATSNAHTSTVNGAVRSVDAASPVASPERVRVGDLEMPQVWGVPASSSASPARPTRSAMTSPGVEGIAVEVAPVPPLPAGGEAGRADPVRGGRRRWWRREPRPHYPDGVLPPAGRDLSVLVGVVGTAAVAEAGWNVGSAVYTMLHLPLLLAASFPAVLEAAAASCALQDIRDRRQGVHDPRMEAGAYLGLGVSAAVNGTVGWASYGAGGLLEILPPMVLGGLIWVHGRRQERAYRSRARLSPQWRDDQLAQAQVDSAVEALPLLAGDDEDGRATVALLKRRLDDRTLTPAEALIAAGWHDRETRITTSMVARAAQESRRRRLETIAATVWPTGEPPAPPSPIASPPASPVGSPVASPVTSPVASPVASPVTSPVASPRTRTGGIPSGRSARQAGGRSSGGSGQPTGRGGGGARMASDEELAELITRARAQRPGAGEPTIRAALKEAGLTASTDRLRTALRAQNPGGQAPTTVEAITGPQNGSEVSPQADPRTGQAAGTGPAADLAGAGGDDA